jgi:hypothetical protein
MMHEGFSLLLLLYVFFFTVISVAVNIFICYRVEPRSQEGTNDARRVSKLLLLLCVFIFAVLGVLGG